MSEVSLRQIIVCLNDFINVLLVDGDSNSHEHVLGTLGDLAVDFHEVTAFQSFEPKEIVVEVSVIDDH